MKILSFLKVIAFSVICLASHVSAKSGGYSSSSSSSSSSSRSSSSSSWGSSSSSAKVTITKPTPQSSNSYSKPNTAQTQTSTRPTSKADVARYEAASKSGKTFTTRESAVADFKTKNATAYTSKYIAEPSQRPSHIPKSYADSAGTRREIAYNPIQGGYGYYLGGGPGLGTFMLYDALSDAAMTNTLMSRQNYYVGPAPSNSWGIGVITSIIAIVVVLIGLGCQLMFAD